MRYLLAVFVGCFLVGWNGVAAVEPVTKITIPDMDCPSCAKKVGGKVGEVSGVGKVEYDVQTKVVFVTPKAGMNLSPRALWESVERGGKAPAKIEGPGGVFTAKPVQ